MADPLLTTRQLRGGYGEGDVLRGIDLDVDDGEVVAVLGPNGAGKSTLLRAIAGFLPHTSGTILLQGVPIRGQDPALLARCGLYLVPERHAVFPNLTVADNLRLATAAPEARWRHARDDALDLFPKLRERQRQTAGTLSGGERQMLALARAFAARPRILLLDEPSVGLAPRIVDEVFVAVGRFREAGIATVVVEQYVDRALAVADRAAILDRGQIAWTGPAASAEMAALATGYLGSA